MTRVSAASKLGPHLLGRKTHPGDNRDWHLAHFLASDADLVAQAEAELKQTKVGYTYFTNKKISPPSDSHWAKALALLAQIGGPPPPPPGVDKTWDDVEAVLDQGDTPHCVGFGSAQWCNTVPVDDHFKNADGDDIYYACKEVDGEPGAEDGSYVHTAAKVLKTRGRLSSYAWTNSIGTMQAWLLQKGPLVVGVDWYNDMFNPDADGYVAPTGGIAGGHCFAVVGELASEDAFLCLNSWGKSWAVNGRFKMKHADFNKLLTAQGAECMAALELP